MRKPTLGILGGKGKMGGWLAHELKSAVRDVLLYDVEEVCSLEEFIQRCELIAVSVPISKTEAVLNQIQPFLKEDQCVFDLTSLKEQSCALMKTFPCAAFGLHPLFGPAVQDPAFKMLVFCSVQVSEWDDWFKTHWKKKNYQIVDMDPSVHDQKMAWIQAMNPLLHFTLGASVNSALSMDLKSLMTPSFSLFFQTLIRFMKQDPNLYFEMAAYNPYFLKAHEGFQNQFSRLTKALQEKDEQVFHTTFQDLQVFIQEIQS